MKLRFQNLFSPWGRDECAASALRSEDLFLLAPLSEMLEERRPEQGLLSEIEAELDASEEATPARNRNQRDLRKPVLSFLLGVGLAASVAFALTSGPPTPISVRASLNQSWLQLGHVALQGKALRSFVAVKCEGQSHLVIELSGYTVEKNTDLPAAGDVIPVRPLLQPDEKILMECNF
ncbi:hypothetical protein [Roseobacter sp. A03A-229]